MPEQRRTIVAVSVISWALAAPVEVDAQASARCELDWTLEEVQRIGSLDGDDALTHPLHLTLGPEGDTYLTQQQVFHITVFDPDGHVDRTIGGPGGGPGEFRGGWPSLMGWSADTLWVLANRSIQYFLDDEEARRVTIRPAWEPGSLTYGYWPGRPFSDGTLGAKSTFHPRAILDGEVSAVTLVRTSAAGEVLDTLLSVGVEGQGIFLDYGDGDGGHAIHPLAFPPWPDFLRHRGGAVAVEPAGSTEDPAFRLWAVSERGMPIFDRTVRYDPVALTDERAESMLSKLVEVFGRNELAALTGEPERRPEGAVRRAVERAIPMPDVLPPVGRVRAGDDDTIWLLREDRSDTRDTWEVFDDTGRLIGRVESPKAASIFHLSGWSPLRLTRDEVWASVRGEYDEPYVVRYQVASGCG